MKIKNNIGLLVIMTMISIAIALKVCPMNETTKSVKDKIIQVYRKSRDIVLAVKEKILSNPKKDKSTAKSALLLPLKTITVTSDFGWRRKRHANSREFHNGIDIKATTGTPVYSVTDGIVYQVGKNPTSGKYITIIDHNKTHKFIYSHLSKIFVKKGEPVKQGKTIGLTGNTGKITGPHLHFGAYDLKNKKYINPKKFIQNK